MSEPLNPRVAIPKRLRMEVFKRDRFTCQYCGATPPDVLLQIDHVTLVARGGTNDELNLVTACEACNQGKGAIPLTQVPATVAARAEREKEIEMQLSEYYRVVRQRRTKLEKRANQVVTDLNLWDSNRQIPMEWFKGIVKFVDSLSPTVIEMLVDTANDALGHKPAANRFYYFAKACWNNIRDKEERNER